MWTDEQIDNAVIEILLGNGHLPTRVLTLVRRVRNSYAAELTDLRIRASLERRWVPVSEKLPPIGKMVIVYCPEDERRLVGPSRLLQRYESDYNPYWEGFGLGVPTHWMLFPDPPDSNETATNEGQHGAAHRDERNRTMKTYKVTVGGDVFLALPSNATIVDHEGDGETTDCFIEVDGNYARFEQQLDTIDGVYSYEIVEDEGDE